MALDPKADGARFSYATALFRQQKAVQALPHVERLLAQSPNDPAYRNLMAACLGLVGEHERVLTRPRAGRRASSLQRMGPSQTSPMKAATCRR